VAPWTGLDAGDPLPGSIRQIVDLAAALLPLHLWDHAAGGAGTEATLDRNRTALARWLFRPRVLAASTEGPSTSTRVLGVDLATPFMLAPVGPLELYDPGGASAAARAAHDAGAMSFVATSSAPSLEEVAASAPGPLAFQLYVRGDRSWVADTVRRVAEAGYRALCLTVDAPLYGRRERDIAHRFVHTDHMSLPNLPAGGSSSQMVEAALVHQGALTWGDVSWIAALSDLPLILKGIMCAEDARLAVEHGAAAVYVSNHGGRLLDHMEASIEVLPEVVEAVGDRVEGYVDGGFLHGEDVAKALALGARAVLIGKLQVWGLAADGHRALHRVLQLMTEELACALPQLGVASVTELHPGLLVLAD
jgi:isopentenyl diphosphate isomerase/L-lactate dehydrogenase-like FMN-dependent dehydrogenase